MTLASRSGVACRGREREAGQELGGVAAGEPALRSHCRFALPPIPFIPDSRTYSVHLCLNRQSRRTSRSSSVTAARSAFRPAAAAASHWRTALAIPVGLSAIDIQGRWTDGPAAHPCGCTFSPAVAASSARVPPSRHARPPPPDTSAASLPRGADACVTIDRFSHVSCSFPGRLRCRVIDCHLEIVTRAPTLKSSISISRCQVG
jgi:hypothetical protein